MSDKFSINMHSWNSTNSKIDLSYHPKVIMSVKGSSGRGAKKEKRRSYSNKAGLQFPVARIGRYLRKAKVANRVAKGDKWNYYHIAIF